jgi:hypothetical protein
MHWAYRETTHTLVHLYHRALQDKAQVQRKEAFEVKSRTEGSKKYFYHRNNTLKEHADKEQVSTCTCEVYHTSTWSKQWAQMKLGKPVEC